MDDIWITLLVVTGTIVALVFFVLRRTRGERVSRSSRSAYAPANPANLARQLADLGFYGGAAAPNLAGDSLFTAESGRVFAADGEDLADGWVGHMLAEMKPYLVTQGVLFEEIEDRYVPGGAYDVLIDGEVFAIYGAAETDDTAARWDLATSRAFALVNTLLRRAHARERIYLLYGGNDGQAVFLSRSMFQLISASRDLPNAQKPRRKAPRGEEFL